MAFVIKKDKSYMWPVTISEPIDDGLFNDQKARVKFKMMTQARLDEVVKNENEEDADILGEVLIGWEEGTFKDESGASIDYTPDNKDLVLSVPYIRNAMIKGFFDSIAGKAFKRKN